MNIGKRLASLAAAITFSISTCALADVSLTYQSVKTPEHRSTILVSKDYIRFENPMAPEFFMLFDVKRQLMTLVDSDKRSYSTLDRETLESLSEQIEVTRKAIMAELKASMKVAEGEEKAQMAMIHRQIEQLAEAPQRQLVQYQPLQQEKEINGYQCSMIQARVDDTPQAELCVISAEQAGLSDASMQALKSFHSFSNSVHQQLNPGDTTELLFVMNSKNRLPVSIRRLQPQSAIDEYQLMQVKRLSIPETAFAVPATFEAKDIEDAFIID